MAADGSPAEPALVNRKYLGILGFDVPKTEAYLTPAVASEPPPLRFPGSVRPHCEGAPTLANTRPAPSDPSVAAGVKRHGVRSPSSSYTPTVIYTA